jgi:hypothetical protein
MTGAPIQPESGHRPQDGLWVWGVDVSTKRLAVGFSDGQELHVESVDFNRKLFHGLRLEDIFTRTRTFAAAWAKRYPPLYVFVEQPAAFGRPPEPQLMYAVGMVQGALTYALHYVHPHPVEVRTVPIGTWKSRALGNGAAKKPEIMDWAVKHGYRGLLQDEADAMGIALAGWRLLEPQPEQLQLAS